MGKKRQLEKQEEIRNTILGAARKIIAQEGIQGLSIRKITNAMDYSPAIVYHYFKDKNEIIDTIVNEGFERILTAVHSVSLSESEPVKQIREIFENYLRAALAIPEEYKAVMLNDDPAVLKRTGLLEQGIAGKSPTMKVLCDNLRRGMESGAYVPADPELTAQIIWTSTFGLIIKLIIEKDIPQAQVERLIDQHFHLILRGIMSGKEAGKT